jgi:hypothetical protein
MIIANVATASKRGALNQPAGTDQRHDEELSPGEHRHGVKTHLASGDDRLEDESVPA